MNINIISAEEWQRTSEDTHKVVFGKIRTADTDRIDYAAVAQDAEGKYIGYITVHDLNNQCAYWQFGGAFPWSAKTIQVYKAVEAFIDWTKRAGYRHIFTRIENNNLPWLKMAMKIGFRVVGVIYHDGEILLEHKLTLIGEER